MSFYSDLDDKGKKLYDEYIRAQKEWIDYIIPKVSLNIKNYLDGTKRKYDAYAYLNFKYSDICYICDMYSTEKTEDSEIKKIFKNLSLKFHPDKFNNNLATNIFSKINELYLDNQIIILRSLEIASELILNLKEEDIQKIIHNLDKKYFENLNIKLDKSLSAIDIINVLSIADNDNENVNDKNDTKFYDNFLQSLEYQFFINKHKTKKWINQKFLTEEELIEEINNMHDVEQIQFYYKRYKDDENIFEACVKRYIIAKIIIEQKENEYLKNKLQK